MIKYLDTAQEKRVVIDVFFAGGCVICGERDRTVLDAHHLKPRISKKSTIAVVARNRTLDILEKELAKCVPLCANCHRRVHAGKLTIKH